MFYEIFLITLGIYIEQTYKLPLLSNIIAKIKNANLDTYKKDDNDNNNNQGENFLNDLYKSFFTKK